MGLGRELEGIQTCIVSLTKEQRVGLAFIGLSSGLSLLVVLIVVCLYVRNFIRTIRSSQAGGTFFNTDIDIYFLSLLISDGLISSGGIMNFKWVVMRFTVCGDFCTAQGLVQQLGTPGVALSTLAIAVHTFFVIFFNWTPPVRRFWGLTVVSSIWTYITLVVLLGWFLHRTPGIHFYSPTPFWCWIDERYVVQRILGDYLYPWLASLLLLVIYGLLFLRLRGWIVASPDRWSHIRIGSRGSSSRVDQDVLSRSRWQVYAGSDAGAELAQREAGKMLWYPLCYMIIILPMSVVRWLHFSDPQNAPPFVATAITASLFKLSGVIDVVLFLLTRPNLLVFGGRSNFQRRSGVEATHPPLDSREIGVAQDVEFKEIPTSATPILPSPSLEATFSALHELPPPNPNLSPPSPFKPLVIDIPSSRLSNVSGVWRNALHEEQGLERPRTPLWEKVYSEERLLDESRARAANMESFGQYRHFAGLDISAQEKPGPSSRRTRSSFKSPHSRIHSFTPVWEQAVRDIIGNDDDAKAAFVSSATGNVRSSILRRLQVDKGDTDVRRSRWNVAPSFLKTPAPQTAYQGAHPRLSPVPRERSTSPLNPSRVSEIPTLYHLPTRVGGSRQHSPSSTHHQIRHDHVSSQHSPPPQVRNENVDRFDHALHPPRRLDRQDEASPSTSASYSHPFSTPRHTATTFTSLASSQNALRQNARLPPFVDLSRPKTGSTIAERDRIPISGSTVIEPRFNSALSSRQAEKRARRHGQVSFVDIS